MHRGHGRCGCHDSAATVFAVFFSGLIPVFCCCFVSIMAVVGAWGGAGVSVCNAVVFVGYGIVMGLNSGGHHWISVSYLTLFSIVSLVGLF